jgi:protein arginine kinase activator
VDSTLAGIDPLPPVGLVMNACYYCGEPSTIHYTSIIGKKKVQQHLCEACAREQGVVTETTKEEAGSGPTLNLQMLVNLIMNQQAKAIDTTPLACPDCGLKYSQFRAEGRLGCANDYDVFAEMLLPILVKAHRDSTHTGKVPASRAIRTEHDRQQLDLQRAIAEERYEDAARLRDALAKKDAPR